MKITDRIRFETLYRRHSRSVFALAWRLCRFNSADAEDVTQETFLRALSPPTNAMPSASGNSAG